MSTAGDNPQDASRIVYWIMIENKDTQPASNIQVWDTLPPELEFIGVNTDVKYTITGNIIFWQLPSDYILEPGKTVYVEFTARIINYDGQGIILNSASVDYNDPYYTPATGRHPALNTSIIQYPEALPVVFPNPFNKSTAVNGELKFANVPPGSTIQIYTLSGERVISMEVKYVRAAWDGKNSAGREVSSGIYFYVIKNMHSLETITGKFFIIK
jgi:uncharacterized repeat protein (TIGR01451 family)